MKIKFKTLKELLNHPSFSGFSKNDDVFFWYSSDLNEDEVFPLSVLGKEVDLSTFSLLHMDSDSTIKDMTTGSVYSIDNLKHFSDFTPEKISSITDCDGETYVIHKSASKIHIGCRSFYKKDVKKIVNILLAELNYNPIK